MRVLARIGYSLTCLALLAPAVVRAGMPIVAGAPWTPAQQMAAKKASASKSGKPGEANGQERLCADCLRKKMLKEGVSLPPAPPLPYGGVARDYKCTVCGKPAAVNAGGISQRRRPSVFPMMADRSAPGRAAVGGETAGYAVIGNDPAPIGVVESRLAAGEPARGPAGPRDPSVMPTANVSSPSDPLMPTHEKNPRVLTHLFGLSAIGRERSLARERRDVEKHARIAYGDANTDPVRTVPASAVYGR